MVSRPQAISDPLCCTKLGSTFVCGSFKICYSTRLKTYYSRRKRRYFTGDDTFETTDDELCKDHKVQSLVSLHLWLAAVVVSPDLNALFLPGCSMSTLTYVCVNNAHSDVNWPWLSNRLQTLCCKPDQFEKVVALGIDNQFIVITLNSYRWFWGRNG